MVTWNGFRFQLDSSRAVLVFPGEDLDLIESSIYQILNTVSGEQGERVHLPEFGSKLKLLVFEPLDEFLAIQLKEEIKDAINRWEDRVYISSVRVFMPQESTAGEGQHQVTVVVRYVVKSGLQEEREFRIEA